jgi:hypothetical protein
MDNRRWRDGEICDAQETFAKRTWLLQVILLKIVLTQKPCCATEGEGLYEGFEWLSNTLREK